MQLSSRSKEFMTFKMAVTHRKLVTCQIHCRGTLQMFPYFQIFGIWNYFILNYWNWCIKGSPLCALSLVFKFCTQYSPYVSCHILLFVLYHYIFSFFCQPLGHFFLFLVIACTNPCSFLGKITEVICHCLLPRLKENNWPKVAQLLQCLRQD